MRAFVASGAARSRVGEALRPRAAALALWLGAGALLSGCTGEPAQPTEQAPPASQPSSSPILHEITDPEGRIQGWLLGTIHALPDGTLWRTGAIDRAIDKADYLIVEIADPGSAAARAAFLELSASAGLPPLAQRIAPPLRGELSELASAAGTSLAAFGSTETWAAALILAQAMRTGDPANGVDRALIAQFSGRDIRELEGARAQLRIFDSLAEEDQRALLESVIGDFGDGIDQAGELRTAWLTGNAARIEAATRTGMLADPELREAILIARNRAWAARLDALLARGEPPLIAVGAAHLVGPDGLPALLEARGYTLRPQP